MRASDESQPSPSAASTRVRLRTVNTNVPSFTVSACYGAGDEPLSPTCYPSRFFTWWNSVFPHPASELTNGAMRRTNSAYFSFCNAHHVPDVTDLVIVEIDTDDDGYVVPVHGVSCALY